MIEDVPLASSAVKVPRSRIRELADIAFKMKGVLRLHFGESNLPTPQFIVDAASRAMEDGYTFYTENAGLPSLRAAIADKYTELHGVNLDPASEVLVTASGVQALNVAIRCVIDPGDEAIVLTPNWPNASSNVSLCGGRPIEVPFARAGKGFTIDFAALEAAVTPRTRLFVYASPSNPLGWVATPSVQRDILDFCRRHRLWLLADEVYERLYFSGPVAPSMLKLCTRSDAVIVAHSFSKSYCMTGWRLGWLVSRADLVRQAAELNEFIVSHAPSMIQRAGEVALRQGEESVRQMAEAIRERVRFCYEALSSLDSVWLAEPDGAFYLFPSIHGIGDSFSFARGLLESEKVSVAPGVAFGNGGEGSIRICAAADRSVLEPAMKRLCRYLER